MLEVWGQKVNAHQFWALSKHDIGAPKMAFLCIIWLKWQYMIDSIELKIGVQWPFEPNSRWSLSIFDIKRFCKPTTERFVCDFSSQFNFFQHFYVEFTQPATCVSHTVLRSVSILNGSGEPPEKFAKYLARQEYKLEIEFADKEESSYKVAAKQVKKQLCYYALNRGSIVVGYKKATM